MNRIDSSKNKNEIDIDIVLTYNNEENENDPFEIQDPDVKEHLQKEGKMLILFVNPLSGSQEGKIIMDLAAQYKVQSVPNFSILKFPPNEEIKSETTTRKTSINLEQPLVHSFRPAIFEPNYPFSAIFFNILDANDYTKGKKFLKTYLNYYKNNFAKIIIGGGDGTVLRLVEDMNHDNIQIDRCIFGLIPLGTGNDLSNSMGFGNRAELKMKMTLLQRVLYTYVIAENCKIDLWELILNMKEDGVINDVVKDGEHPKNDQNGVPIKQFRKTFINYMSIGYDAKVGFNFEQKRSSSRCVNKLIYFWEGFKRFICCKRNIPLAAIIDKFESIEQGEELLREGKIYDLEDSSEIEIKNNQSLREFNEDDVDNIENDNDKEEPLVLNKGKKTIFRTNKEKGKQKVVLRGNPIDIICQNINFYMGGTRNIWEKSGSHLGLKMINAKEEDMREYKSKIIGSFNEQKYDDKKIEFFAYESGFSMALEKVASGQALKLYQGEGPVLITFKRKPNEKEIYSLNKVYLNADGEFFHLLQPKDLIVRLNTDICGGQINFLRNVSGIKG